MILRQRLAGRHKQLREGQEFDMGGREFGGAVRSLLFLVVLVFLSCWETRPAHAQGS